MSIELRKKNHIDICLKEDVRSQITNGFEKYRLIHNALPESDFSRYSIETEFLGKTVSAPFLISSMTGGTEAGEKINHQLLTAANELNLPFAIGSQRIYLLHPEIKPIHYRKIAPNIPLLANVGAVQLNYGFKRDDFLRAVEMIGADALILHLNPLQELIQKNGDTDFSGLLEKIGNLCRDFPVPVVIKEVGYGINYRNAAKLSEAGAAMIDVAGAGGTSWSQVERFLSDDKAVSAAAEPFRGWGIPTAECIASIHEHDPEIKLIASGGIMDGVEAAKAVYLGADIVGLAARLLPFAADRSPEALINELKTLILQYKTAMFLSDGIELIQREA